MDTFWIGLDWLEGVIALLFFLVTIVACIHLRQARRLPSLDSLSIDDPAPLPLTKVSVVIACRDEANRIEQTVRHLLAQKAIDLELIVVDDRSTDSSRDILTRLACEDHRIRVIQIDQLPDGWLGKCHACYQGAQKATGDWILFTDADCWLKPDVIQRALLIARREKADHITMTPGIPGETVTTQAWHIAFLITVVDWFAGVNQDKPGRYLGMGAFNFVKSDVYRECGGYETLKLCVIDDVKLGYLIQRIGKRTRAFVGGDETLCHWGGSIFGMIKVMEKNYFAAVDYKVAFALSVSLGGLLVWGLAMIGPFTGRVGGVAAGIGLLSLIVPSMIIARRLGWSIWGAILSPFLFPFLFFAILWSTWVTLRQGGVRWRDTFYPLAVLRNAKLP